MIQHIREGEKMAGMMGLVIDLVAEEIGVVNFWVLHTFIEMVLLFTLRVG